MERNSIINKVLTNIDELAPFDAGLIVSVGNETTNPLHNTISSILDDVAKTLIMLAPLPLLKMKALPGVTVEDNKATVVFPDDFVRLGFVQFPCWTTTIVDYIKIGSEAYNQSINPYTKGGLSRPIAIEKMLPEQKKGIEFSKITDDDNGGEDVQFYVPFTLPENLEDFLIPAYSWLVASEVYLIFEKPNESKLASEKFIGLLNSIEPNKSYS